MRNERELLDGGRIVLIFVARAETKIVRVPVTEN